jgi:hypothetical protein
MAHAILVLSKGVLPPTRAEIAEALSVDERTVQRWLAELRSAGILTERRVGRRNLCVFVDPSMGDTCDQVIVGSGDPRDQVIVGSPDPTITHDTPDQHQFSNRQDAENSDKSEISIGDPRGGGGGHDSQIESKPPTPTPRAARTKVRPEEITGDTGKWMVEQGFSLAMAHKHQDLPLAVAQADYHRRQQFGQRHGAIAQAWEVSPPAAPVQLDTDSWRAQLRQQYGDLFRFGSDSDEGGEQ